MHRGTLCFLLGLGIFWALWHVVAEATRDVAVLEVRDVENSDRFVTLWAVEDGDLIWLRAARPDREWLEWLEERSGAEVEVELEVDDEASRYTAAILDQPEARERVDELMREKYPWADRVRALLLGDDTVPVRLTPVE